MTWGDDLADWWLGEVAGDPAYREQVVPLALDIAGARPGERWLDLGCGEGRMMRALGEWGVSTVGCDLSARLAREATGAGPVVVGRLPDLGWLADGTLDGALALLVLEHIEDVEALFAETGRVVRPGGALAIVCNHPVMTAVDSAPVYDQIDGEILWRWGDYFGRGVTSEPAGEGSVEFHHRSIGALLNAAAGAGWWLERLEERAVGEDQAARDPLLGLQTNVPRLMAARWRRHT